LQKHPIHSALSLIVVMVALAGLYLLMVAECRCGADHRSTAAPSWCCRFVIMLLNAGEEGHTDFSSSRNSLACPLALALTDSSRWS